MEKEKKNDSYMFRSLLQSHHYGLLLSETVRGLKHLFSAGLSSGFRLPLSPPPGLLEFTSGLLQRYYVAGHRYGGHHS